MMVGVPPITNVMPSFSIIMGIVEVPFFLLLMLLGITVYFKTKNRAIKYTIILFPIIMLLSFRVLYIGSGFHFINYHGLDRTLYPIFIFIAFVLGFITCAIGVLWYTQDRDKIILYLSIFFALYVLSGLLIFFADYYWRFVDSIVITSAIMNLVAYLVGISAMIVALVRPKRMLAAK